MKEKDKGSSKNSKANYCQVHFQEFELFCETCDEPICSSCTQHNTHRTCSLSNAIGNGRESLIELLELVFFFFFFFFFIFNFYFFNFFFFF